ncbi:hypothetical protein EES44_02860 [Streptomyces sp. ADI96-15]|nr:hypothetical protein EES44_02860 [Streptomyces sp. ADI96-15]
MKRLAPRVRPSSARRRASAAGTVKSRVLPSAVLTCGRGRSVGRSSGSSPASRVRQWASWASSASPVCCSRCQTAKSGYWTGSAGRTASSPRTAAAYSSLSSRVMIPIDQPSVTMWCIAITRTCSAGATRTSRTRNSGPVRRSNGRTASARSTASTSSAPVTPTVRTGTSTVSWTTWTPRPSTASKVVRSASCRATRPATALPSAASSSVPVRRSAPTTLYSTEPGVKFSRNHRRSCGSDMGSCPPRATGTTGDPARPASSSPSPPSISAARRATVGWSKRARGERCVPRTVRAREVTFRLEMESPPRPKKSSSTPTRSAPSTSAQIAHRARSVSVRGSVYAAPAGVNSGAGRARRSTLPLTVSGIASTAM